MRILVLGSGVLGVTTAYELGKRGFEVTVLDRQLQSGAETSYANGGQLSYSHAEPWANPSVWQKLPQWLFKADAPLVFRPRADRAMMQWGLKFLRNCASEHAYVNCVNLLRLGLYSRQKMEAIRNETGIAFDFGDNGILHIFSSDKDFEQAIKQNEFQAKFGGERRPLTPEEVLALEPSLAHTSRKIVGGMHASMDECGDAFLYCRELAKVATEKYNVQFHYGVTLSHLLVEKEAIVAAVTDHGDMTADSYVMALGSYSTHYLYLLGIDVPIYPMKGYSITIDANDACPRSSITDGTHKIVYSRLGTHLRVSGTAEFAGYNTAINQKRIAPIVKAASELFPRADWNQDIDQWACLRPSTPDGPPVIGPTPYPNLFLNTGHGTLGWTQAAGSAAVLADLMERKPPGIMLYGLTLERYI